MQVESVLGSFIRWRCFKLRAMIVSRTENDPHLRSGHIRNNYATKAGVAVFEIMEPSEVAMKCLSGTQRYP